VLLIKLFANDELVQRHKRVFGARRAIG